MVGRADVAATYQSGEDQGSIWDELWHGNFGGGGGQPGLIGPYFVSREALMHASCTME